MALEPELTQWLRRVRQGCPEARAQLLTWCRAYQEGHAGCRIPADCRARGDAEDLIQETLRRFDHALDGSDGLAPDGVVRLLLAVQKRAWQDFRKRHRNGKRDVRKERTLTEAAHGNRGHATMAGDRSPLDGMILREDVERLPAALACLSAKDRQVLRLHYEEGMPFPQIGQLLGMSGNAAKLRHRKALRRLRRDWPAGDGPSRARKG